MIQSFLIFKFSTGPALTQRPVFLLHFPDPRNPPDFPERFRKYQFSRPAAPAARGAWRGWSRPAAPGCFPPGAGRPAAGCRRPAYDPKRNRRRWDPSGRRAR